MLTRNEILDKLIEIKPLLSENFAVTKIGLFGSFGDNTFTDDSDIDLLVELKQPIGWKYFTLQIFLENTFGRKIDLVTKQALKEPLKDTILEKVTYV